MSNSFEEHAILTDLKELDDVRRLAFGVCLLERALSGFFQFQIDTGCSGGGELRAALAQCWSVLEKGFQTPTSVLVAACEKVMPDSETYSSVYTSAAIDAVNIACCLLDFIAQRNLDQLMEAVQARRDTFEIFIQNATGLEPVDSNFEEELAAHPLIQEEVGFLYGDLAFLRSTPGTSAAVWSRTLDRIITRDYRRPRLAL